MKWRDTILCYIALMVLPSVSVPGSIHSILDQIKPGVITIIGETHRRKESIQLFQGLVTDYLRQKKCLTVALEIDSAEQPEIDRVLQGRAAASDLEIAPMIDHPPLRKMIDDLALLKRNGACLLILAIDTSVETRYNRDKWMAKQLAEQGSDAPILVLLGALHTLKRVDWNLSMTKPSPSVAAILVAKGYQVKTYPQVWRKDSCTGESRKTSRYVSVEEPEALALLNDSLISLINAFLAKTARGVVDGFVVWECNK